MTTSRWLIPWGIFVAFALLLTGSVESAAQSSAPALAQQVEILRTQYGVPHVKGQTLAAAAFGMGYCQAEDHLLTIMGQMISARGESAKYFGGRRNVERDFFNRQFRIYSGAVERYHRIDPDIREMLDTSRFPPYFPRPRLGLRTQHSLELIHNERRFSLEDVRDMKFSMRMLLAERVKDDLIRALDEANPEGEVKEAVALLKQWDNSVSAQSRGSVLFETWWRRYARSSGYVPAGNRTAFASNWTPEDPMATPRGLGDRERAVEAFGWALEETRNRHGAWDVAWGDVHRLRRGGVDLPIGGASGSLGAFRVLTFKRAEDGKRVANNGDSWVFAVEFSTPPRAYSVVAYSESGNVDSPHFSDQSVLFANNQMKKVAFTQEQIAEQLIAAYRPGEEASESR